MFCLVSVSEYVCIQVHVLYEYGRSGGSGGEGVPAAAGTDDASSKYISLVQVQNIYIYIVLRTSDISDTCSTLQYCRNITRMEYGMEFGMEVCRLVDVENVWICGRWALLQGLTRVRWCICVHLRPAWSSTPTPAPTPTLAHLFPSLSPPSAAAAANPNIPSSLPFPASSSSLRNPFSSCVRSASSSYSSSAFSSCAASPSRTPIHSRIHPIPSRRPNPRTTSSLLCSLPRSPSPD